MNTDKNGVDRFEPHQHREMRWDVDGDYILFADHERVVEELAHLNFVKAEVIRDFVSDIETLRTALAASRAEVEGLKKDAERYRWLTKENDWDVQPRVLIEDGVTLSVTVYSPQRLFDRFGEVDDIGGAIDAAMDKGNG